MTSDTIETPVEPKHEKFKALAEKRTNKALTSIRLIGNLSNRVIYRYEEQEIRKIIKALQSAVSDVEARFKATDGEVHGGFTL